MKLYYSPGACSLTPHIVLREAGCIFELIRVDLAAKKTANGEDFWAINPKGYVPALQLDNGDVLSEVSVICQYLADHNPAAALAPAAGTMARYHLLEWLNFIATEVHKSIGALFNPKMTPEMKLVQIALIERRLKPLEQYLADQLFIMGDHFSVADAYLFNVMNWAPRHQMDVAQWPHIQAFVARVAARPHVQAALREEGLIR